MLFIYLISTVSFCQTKIASTWNNTVEIKFMWDIQSLDIPYKVPHKHQHEQSCSWLIPEENSSPQCRHRDPPLLFLQRTKTDALAFSCVTIGLHFFLNPKLESKHKIWAEFNLQRRQNLQDTTSPLLVQLHNGRPLRSLTYWERAINHIWASIRQHSILFWRTRTLWPLAPAEAHTRT